MKKPDKKKILKALKILFGVLVVVFLAWYFWKNWDEFSDKIMNVDMGIFIFSMLFYFLYKITLASLWHYITKLNGCAIKYEKAVTSYLYSILGKYIPGKVFMLAARLTYYKEEDAPLSKVTVCFFIDNVCTLLDVLSDLVQVHVSRNQLGERVGDADDRTAELLFAHAVGTPQAPGSGHAPARRRDGTSEWVFHLLLVFCILCLCHLPG